MKFKTLEGIEVECTTKEWIELCESNDELNEHKCSDYKKESNNSKSDYALKISEQIKKMLKTEKKTFGKEIKVGKFSKEEEKLINTHPELNNDELANLMGNRTRLQVSMKRNYDAQQREKKKQNRKKFVLTPERRNQISERMKVANIWAKEISKQQNINMDKDHSIALQRYDLIKKQNIHQI